jgi:hypothetical protein
MTIRDACGAARWIFLFAALVVSTACSSRHTDVANSAAPPAGATVFINAKISKGTRFIFYDNNDWNRRGRLPIVAGEWHEYVFSTRPTLTSIHLGPTELPDGEAEIRTIRFESAGQPTRVFPLTDLQGLVKSNAEVEPKLQTGNCRNRCNRAQHVHNVFPLLPKAIRR